jgi:tetratricopeptide (TPR) repeat protein
MTQPTGPAPFAELVAAHPAFALALKRHADGDLAGAHQAYLALCAHPALTAASLHQLGVLALAAGELPRACGLFHHSLRLEPARVVAHMNLAATLDKLGQPQAACAALLDMGGLLQTARHFGDAAGAYRQLLAREPLNYGGWVNLGTCLAQLDQLGQAAECLLRAFYLYGRLDVRMKTFAAQWRARLGGRLNLPVEEEALPPGLPVGRIEKIEDALTTCGKVMSESGWLSEAIACHRQSIVMAPGFALAHWNLALALLLKGDFAKGWREYEWRWRWPEFPEKLRTGLAAPWQGEPVVAKRILVYAEQGLGDTMQFAPLVRRLARDGAQVVFEVLAPLQRLLAEAMPEVTVIERGAHPGDIRHPGPFDFAVPLMSLPPLLRLTSADLPLDSGWLGAPQAHADAWREQLPETGSTPRIGLVWAGRPEHANDARRSLPLARLWESLGERDAEWVSLQVGPAAAQLQGLPEGSILDLGAQFSDFADTAGAMSRLDLLICVDTSVAHLAGSMGVPAWVLLPYVPDWRWGQSGAQTPWYPQARLFRQAARDDWSGALSALSEALAERFGPVRESAGEQAPEPA